MTVADVCEVLQTGLPANANAGDVVSGAAIDSRLVEQGNIFFALSGSRSHGVRFIDDALAAGACIAVVPEGNAGPRRVAVDDVHEAMLRLASIVRAKSSAIWVAVTGSVGKTTTRELITALLSLFGPVHQSSKNFNNHLGVPLSMLGVRAEHKHVVVEIGTSHPGEIASLGELVQPKGAVITAVREAHLDGLGTIEGVLREKLSLIDAVSSDGWGVVPDDKRVVGGLSHCSQSLRVVEPWAAHLDEAGATHIKDTTGNAFCVPILGLHLGELVPLAVAAAEMLIDRALTPNEIQSAFDKLVPIGGRSKLTTVLGRTVIDDSYNANPASMTAALMTLSQFPTEAQRIAILGDMLELGEQAVTLHRTVANQCPANIDRVISIGEFARHWGPNAVICRSREELVAKFLEQTTDGDVVLVKGSRGMRLDTVFDDLRAMSQ